MARLTLRLKLLLLLPAVAAAAVLAVGGALIQQTRDAFEQQAESRFAETRRALIADLQAREKQSQAKAVEVAQREEVIAAANLVFSYQSKERYQAQLFDREKQNLAKALATSLFSDRRGDRRVVAVYDGHGDLVSFARADGDAIRFGFLSYEHGKPIPYVSSPEASEWVRASSLPENCADEEGGAVTPSGYGQCNGRFVLRVVVPVVRTFPSGASLQVGRVVLSEQLGSEMAARIFDATGARLALYLHNKPLGGTLEEIAFDESLTRAAVPLLRDGATRSWREEGRYLLQPYSVPLGGVLNAYLVVGVEKSGVAAQEASVRGSVQQVVIGVVPLAALIALLAAWWIEHPARRQLAHVAAIVAGERNERAVVVSDAIGALAFQAQELALSQRASRALEEQLAEERARIDWQDQALRQAELALTTLAREAERRTPALAGHAGRVADRAAAIAAKMGLPDEQVRSVRVSALLQGVGNTAVPAALFEKAAPFTPNERAAMKAHAKAGYDLLKEIPGPWPLAQVALQHHERMDGSGYPTGLRGDDIVLAARIVAVADVVEAMLAPRPHRAAHSRDEVIRELESKRNTAFDAQVVDACLAVLEDSC